MQIFGYHFNPQIRFGEEEINIRNAKIHELKAYSGDPWTLITQDQKLQKKLQKDICILVLISELIITSQK